MEKEKIEIIGAVVTVITAFITSLVGPSIVEYIKVKIDKTQKKDLIKSEMSHAHIINEELDDIREKLNSDRAWILLFHNGGHFLSYKKSMKKFSIFYESCDVGISNINTLFNNIPVTLFSKSTQELIINKQIFISDFEDPNINHFGLKSIAEASGTKSHYRIAIFDIVTNQCIGALGIDFLDKTNINEDKKILLDNKTQRIAGFLSNFIKDI
jgi:hypothetical protein